MPDDTIDEDTRPDAPGLGLADPVPLLWPDVLAIGDTEASDKLIGQADAADLFILGRGGWWDEVIGFEPGRDVMVITGRPSLDGVPQADIVTATEDTDGVTHFGSAAWFLRDDTGATLGVVVSLDQTQIYVPGLTRIDPADWLFV